MRRVLTTPAVERMKPPEKGQADIFDITLPGLALRVTARGVKSWVVLYRSPSGPRVGKTRRLTFGQWPKTSLGEARDQARQLLRTISEGVDPADARLADRAVARAGADTVSAVAAEFVERHAKHQNKQWRETERILERYILPVFGRRRFGDVTRREVIAFIEGMTDGRGYQANRVLATMRKMWNWAIARDIVEHNPCDRVARPHKEVARERFLTEGEIRAIWRGAAGLGYPYEQFTKLLILSGQRRSEVATMCWSHIETDDTWVIPAALTKSDRTHMVPLGIAARELIGALPHFETSDLLFSGGRVNPPSGFSRAKRRLDALSGVAGWRFHDIRRTVATNLARLGVADTVISRVLNHAETTVTGRHYRRHDFLSEKRDALERWASYVGDLVQDVLPESGQLDGVSDE